MSEPIRHATIRVKVKRLSDGKEFTEVVSGEEAFLARRRNLESVYGGRLKIEAYSNWVGHEGQETRVSGEHSLAASEFPMEHNGPR
jgi:hypothetical protein